MSDTHENPRSRQVDIAVADYLEALEQGRAPDREAFLAAHADVAVELREFLDDYQAMNRVMPGQRASASTDGAARSTGGNRPAAAPALLLPRSFGDFELLEEIARGGMGVVYRARQLRPDRIVALKMILAGQLASQSDVDRFQVEAHAAAALDHPSIVPIFEVGQHAGQHYFTMGFVAGESLAQRLLAGPLPAREAARLVVEVADAVEYAHGRGIIHRDLKPANILVDVEGRVRVTDFGLAKRQTDESGLTCTGQLLGTPSFMSPEQVSGHPGAVGPASDVYALGATLYALVTGRPPFHAASTVETLRQVTDRDPVPPREFDAGIPRDLETIVLKALAKEPAGRYRTAGAMAEDLRRFLADRPILARRSTVRERMVRWCRRNPLVASLTATAAAALVAGTIASTWQAVRATRAERLAEDRFQTEQAARREADRVRIVADRARAAEAEQRKFAEANQVQADKHRAAAEANYEQAKAAVDKYFTLVSENMLFDVPGLEPLRKDLLEAALKFYEGYRPARSDDPALTADLALSYLRLGQIYLALGRIDECVASARQALSLIERLRRDGPAAAEHLRKLAGFWKGQRWREGGLYMPRDPLPVWFTLVRLETNWKKLAEQYPAEAGFRVDLASLQALMGALLTWSDRPKEGNTYYRAAIVLGEALIAEDPTHPQYRADMANLKQLLADNLVHTPLTDDALALTREAVRLGESLAAELPGVPSYRATLAVSLTSLGSQLRDEQPQEAVQSLRRAEQLAESLAREFPGHVLFVEVWTKALVERALLDAASAADVGATDATARFIEIIDAQVRKRPDSEQFCARITHLLSRLATSRDESAAWLRREPVLKLARELFLGLAEEHPQRLDYWERFAELNRELAKLYRDEGRETEACREYRAAIAAFERFLADPRHGPEEPVISYLELTSVLGDSGQVDAALQSAERAAEVAQAMAEKLPGDLRVRLAPLEAQAARAHRLAKAGRLHEAAAAHQAALSAVDKALRENAKDRAFRTAAAHALRELADGCSAREKTDLGEELLLRALALYSGLAEEFAGDPSRLEYVGHAYRKLGLVLHAAGRLDEACQCYDRATAQFGRLAAADIFQRGGFYRHLQADSLAHQADLLALQDRVADAAATARECAAIYDALVDKYPERAIYPTKMAKAMNHRALLLLKLGDRDAYQHVCRDLCKRANAHWNVEARYCLTRACGLAPDAVSDWNVPLGQALQLVEQQPNNVEFVAALGALLYRAGRFQEAIDSLEKLESSPDRSATSGGFFLAMAHWQLGHHDEARKWYQRAVEWMEQNQPQNEELVRFRAEAERLLGITEPDVAPTNGP